MRECSISGDVKYQSIKFRSFSRACIEIFAKPYPGKSTKYILSLTRKKLTSFVFPGVELDLTKPFLPNNEFITLDFPTFDLPIKAILCFPSFNI